VIAAKLQVKLFFADARPVLSRYIPVFHEWIKSSRLPELLIDVANYAHVFRGPGVALIGDEADYFIDASDGQEGLLYSRKRQAPPGPERLSDAFRKALFAAVLLKQTFQDEIGFRGDVILLRINDRLQAPNTEATFARLRPELERFSAVLFPGHRPALSFGGRGRQLFSVKFSGPSQEDVAVLLQRLAPPSPQVRS
jgi:hypothetical protein